MLRETSLDDIVRDTDGKAETPEEGSDSMAFSGTEIPEPLPDIVSDDETRRHAGPQRDHDDETLMHIRSLLHDAETLPFEELNRLAVFRTDFCQPDHFDATLYHNKIVTDVDVCRLFSAQSALTQVIRDCLERKCIVLIQQPRRPAGKKSTDEVVCELLITGTLQSVLNELEMRFALEVIYPDSTSRWIELSYKLDVEENKMYFFPPEGTTIMCGTDRKRDLLVMNLRYSQGKCCRRQHRLSKTAVAVGEYGFKVALDATNLEQAMNRIMKSWVASAQWYGVPGATLMNFVDPAGQAARERLCKSSMLLPKDAPTITDYRSEPGLWNVVPVTQRSLNCIVESWASIVRAEVSVNFDDSLVHAEQQASQIARIEVQKHDYRMAQAAAKRIVQNSEFESAGGGESQVEEESITTEFSDREGGFHHVNSTIRRPNFDYVEGMAHRDTESEYQSEVESETEAVVRKYSLLDCYFAVFKYRHIYNQTAFPHIEIAPEVARVFMQETFQKRLAWALKYQRERQANLVLKILLKREREHEISRTVRLRNIMFVLNSDMVLASFQAMLDKNVNDRILANLANEMQARHLAKPRDSTWWLDCSCWRWCGK